MDDIERLGDLSSLMNQVTLVEAMVKSRMRPKIKEIGTVEDIRRLERTELNDQSSRKLPPKLTIKSLTRLLRPAANDLVLVLTDRVISNGPL